MDTRRSLHANAMPAAPGEGAALSAAGMPLLERVALPDHGTAGPAQMGGGPALYRAGNRHFTVGLVVHLLARVAPFAGAPLGLRFFLTGGEVVRGHHLLVMQDGRLVGYVGWAACTEEQGLRFLAAEGIDALDFTLREAPAMAFLTLAAVTPGAKSLLRTGLRALHPGRRYFVRRIHGQSGAPVVPRQGMIRPLPGAGGR